MCLHPLLWIIPSTNKVINKVTHNHCSINDFSTISVDNKTQPNKSQPSNNAMPFFKIYEVFLQGF